MILQMPCCPKCPFPGKHGPNNGIINNNRRYVTGPIRLITTTVEKQSDWNFKSEHRNAKNELGRHD